ncbi:MAG: RHS repeat-associated core domain-containing protein, partial [Saprospiraceae bacterium]
VYSQPDAVDYFGKPQRYLQNRVSRVYTDADGNLTTTADRYETWYSYDAHGNVEWMIQGDPETGKHYLAYEYDLISGKVLKVRFNEYRADRFFHRYQYDRENRLQLVETSRDGELWDRDARYRYYLHGPLRRMELGEDRVQGIDYTYTIHGWLKSINTPYNDPLKDPGGDGKAPPAADKFPKDAFGMSLGYYKGDFTRTSHVLTNTNALYEKNSSNTTGNVFAKDLYNGNISHWQHSQIENQATQLGGYRDLPTRTSYYRYDVLNRIKESHHLKGNIIGVPASWATMGNDYSTAYTYDANGNIANLTRFETNGQQMDAFTYNYGPTPKQNNKLQFVEDAELSKVADRADLNGKHTYDYDKIGNTIKDEGPEFMDLGDGNGNRNYTVSLVISWNLYGKTREVNKTIYFPAGSTTIVRREKIAFAYDATGNRVRKTYSVDKNNNNQYEQPEIATTYYIRDAQGNDMGIYSRSNTATGNANEYKASLKLTEEPIYGSDRIGVNNREVLLTESVYTLPQTVAFEVPATGLDIRSEYQNWITDANREIAQGVSKICEGRVTMIRFDASNANQYGSPADLAQYIGIAGNGLAVSENEAGQLQFYVVLAENYLGNGQGVCLILDKSGNLVKGTNLISAVEPGCKPIVVQQPGTNRYAITLLDAAGKPRYSLLNMALPGFGTAAIPAGEITQANLPFDNAPNAAYGRHFIALEDRLNNAVTVYHARYTPDPNPTLPGTAEVLAYRMAADFSMPPVVSTLYATAAFGTQEAGELQLSPDGKRLAWYRHGKNVAAFAHREGDVQVLTLSPDRLGVTGAPTVLPLSAAGNYGDGALEFRKNNPALFFSQRGVFIESSSNSDRNIWQQHPALLTRTPVQGGSTHPYQEIRRAPDGKFYTPLFDTPADKLQRYDAAANVLNTAPLFATAPPGDLYSALPAQVLKIGAGGTPLGLPTRFVGLRQYELHDHLGNVRAVVSDAKRGALNTAGGLTATAAEVGGYWDYYPFGMAMKGRTWEKGNWRYGFNGKENDDEVKGAGNSIDFGERIYDNRLGRFLSTDPLKEAFTSLTPYNFAGNSPILFVDSEGKKIIIYYKEKGKKKTVVINKSDDIKALLTHSNNFVRAVGSDLQKLVDGNYEDIEAAFTSTKTVEIKFKKDEPGEFDPTSMTLLFDPQIEPEDISFAAYKSASSLQMQLESEIQAIKDGKLSQKKLKDIEEQIKALSIDPSTGLGTYQESDETLGHELSHFINFITHPLDYKHRNETKNIDFEQDEDKKVMTGPEKDYRAKKGKGPRLFHWGFANLVKKTDL